MSWSQISDLERALIVIGAIFAIYYILQILNALIFWMRPEKDLLKRWGHGWAVVTGSTDGIGKAFCFELANRGFDICLVARNETKANQVVKELKEFKSTVQCKIVLADFENARELSFFDDIFSQLQKQGITDIACLVNNVGVLHVLPFHVQKMKEIQQEITINCFPVAMLTHKILPLMIERYNKTKKRSGIINLSSASSTVPIQMMTSYSATKAFDNQFTKSLSLEYSNKIDILSLKPGFVQTPMAKNRKDGITAQECAQGGLSFIGFTNSTTGHWKHRFLVNTVEFFDNFFNMSKLMSDDVTKEYYQKNSMWRDDKEPIEMC